VSRAWQAARHCSVIGAAHRRQGRPCQDASLTLALPAPCGSTLQLLAVADGHGGRRYHRSDVGSRLACEQAASAVAAALQCTPLGDTEAWQSQLAQGLPVAIQRGWQSAIEAHWQQGPSSTEEPFAALTYGTTLGLVLLAPGWWGCTGLGDWDLLLISGADAALVSEEAAHGGPAEATASLCSQDAALVWAARAQLRPLPAAGERLSLLLSTDGLRKSCATDADFLQLGLQLAELDDASELEQGLSQISAAGSGDDVSVAIGRWGGGPARAPRRPRRPALLGLTGGLIALAATGITLLLQRPPSPERLIQREAERLCRQPLLIRASLAQRKAVVAGLRGGQRQPAPLVAAAATDPLSALIAASMGRSNRPQPCGALAAALAELWQPPPPASRMPQRPQDQPAPTP
jgi:hypothetical protein